MMRGKHGLRLGMRAAARGVGGGKGRVPEALDPSHDEESQSNPTEIEPNFYIRLAFKCTGF